MVCVKGSQCRMRRQNPEIVFLDCTIRVNRRRNGSRYSIFVRQRSFGDLRKYCTGSRFGFCKLGLYSLEIQFPDSVFAFYTGNPSRTPCRGKPGVFGVICAVLGCLCLYVDFISTQHDSEIRIRRSDAVREISASKVAIFPC
jgi:hypothetical protein